MSGGVYQHSQSSKSHYRETPQTPISIGINRSTGGGIGGSSSSFRK